MNLGLANLFSQRTPAPNPATAAPAPNPAAPNPANQGMDNNNPGAGAGAAPNTAPLPNAQTPDGANASPLDPFKDIFTIDPNKPQSKDPRSDPLFSLDPQKLGAAVGKMDFTKSVNPELVQKALQGDAQAFSQVLNSVSQNAYMLSTQMMTQMMERAFSTNNTRFDSVLEGKFKDFQINSTQPKNEALRHPAAQPVLTALKKQIATQNPTLSASEVTEKAEEYFVSMSKALNTVGDDMSPAKGNNEPKSTDWSNFLNG